MAYGDPVGTEESTDLRCFMVQVRDVPWLVQAVAGKMMDLADPENWFSDDPTRLDIGRDYGAEVALSFAECETTESVAMNTQTISGMALHPSGSGWTRGANSGVNAGAWIYKAAAASGEYLEAEIALLAGTYTLHIMTVTGSGRCDWQPSIRDNGGANLPLVGLTASALATNDDYLHSAAFTLPSARVGVLRLTLQSAGVALFSTIAIEREL